MLRLSPVSLVVAGAAFAIGCAPGPARIGSRDGLIGVETGVQLGWRTKRVATKQPPETLLAEDGTVCRVSPDRYAATEVGVGVACDWQIGAPVRDESLPDSTFGSRAAGCLGRVAPSSCGGMRMGIWSIEGFASDEALDWLGGLAASEGTEPVRRRLRRVVESSDPHLHAGEAEIALAAAELAAALHGRPHPALPDVARRWVEAQRADGRPTEAEALALLVDATRALDLVVTSSALAEIWSQRTDERLWRAALDDLRMRLAAAGGSAPVTPLA